MIAFFSALTIAILFGSAYINHRVFRNNESFFNMFLYCAAFTTVAELTAFSVVDKFKENFVALALTHLLIIGMWILGMFADNYIQRKFFDSKNENNKTKS